MSTCRLDIIITVVFLVLFVSYAYVVIISMEVDC